MKAPSSREASTGRWAAGVLIVVGSLLAPTSVIGAPGAAAAPAPARFRDEVPLPGGPGLVGRWSLDGDRRVVEWRAPYPLPMRGAHPVLVAGGTVVAVPDATDDGRGLTVPLAQLAGVDTRRLEVWLGAERLDRRSQDGVVPRTAGAGAPRAFDDPEVLALDPAAEGPHPTDSFDYRSAPLPSTELTAAMEVRGHVVLPRGVEDAPLVLFLHGRHGACYDPSGTTRVRSRTDPQRAWRCPSGTRPIPSLMGYEYLQTLLASQGYATVSIAANAVNAMDGDTPDFGATARGALVRHHLELIGGWAADPAADRWSGRVDLGSTVLVGHSRGGEGVARAALDTVAASPWDVAGLVLLAPTAANRTSTPHTPSVTLLPYCDGDVVDLTGQTFTDLPRDLDPTDPSLHATVLVRGANHNFFNTEWTPGLATAPTIDDARRTRHPGCATKAPGRLSARQQRGVAEAWVAAAVRLFAAQDPTVLPMFDSAGPVTLATTPYASVLTDAVGGDRTVVRPVLDAATTGAARGCLAALHGIGKELLCGRGIDGFAPRAPHWAYERFRGAPAQHQLELAWNEPGVTGGMSFAEPLDLTGARLDLRVVVDPVLHPRRPTRVDVTLVDGDGDRWSTGTALQPLGDGALDTYWAQTVGIDPATAPEGFDLTTLRAVELAGRSATGRLWLLDVAARRPALLPDDGRRLPVLTVQPRTRVVEGDNPMETAVVRWTLDEAAPVEGHAVVVVLSYLRRRTETPVRFTIPVGATTGVVHIPYPADDEPGTTYSTLVPQPVDGVVVPRPFASLLITDDD